MPSDDEIEQDSAGDLLKYQLIFSWWDEIHLFSVGEGQGQDVEECDYVQSDGETADLKSRKLLFRQK